MRLPRDVSGAALQASLEHLEERREASRNECRRTPERAGPMNPNHPKGRFNPYPACKPSGVPWLGDVPGHWAEYLLEDGGIDAFLTREVLPYAPDAWYLPAAVKIGYEINFNRHFYKPQPLRPLEEIRADIMALERETDGLLAEILGATGRGVSL